MQPPKPVDGLTSFVKKAMGEKEKEGEEKEVTDATLLATQIIFAVQERKPELLAETLQLLFESFEMQPHKENAERPSEGKGGPALLISGEF